MNREKVAWTVSVLLIAILAFQIPHGIGETFAAAEGALALSSGPHWISLLEESERASISRPLSALRAGTNGDRPKEQRMETSIKNEVRAPAEGGAHF